MVQTRPKKAASLRAWLAERTPVDETPEAAILDETVALLSAGPGCPDEAHCLTVAGILESLQTEARTIAAALVFGACRSTGEIPAAWRDPLDPTVRELAEELLKVVGMAALKQRRDAEGLRRLILAVIRDLRVVLVILADQLAQLQDARQLAPRTRDALVADCANLYAPLANRLGIWQIKWQMEDLTFRYRQPETYKRIARLLAARRVEREEAVAGVVATLKAELKAAGIEGEIKGRPKHIYSIWNKMQRKGVGFHEIYDVRAVRVLVNDVAQCYTVLGLVHSKWQHVPGEFDDYIATPKANRYQSLHTAVIGPDGKAFEVQIRTYAMHEHAELGVAAHWRYKEGGGQDPMYERRVAWMRRLLERGDEEELLEEFHADSSEHRVYALTPTGEVKDLPGGATVLDFAYRIHTSVGHRCRGAKVNGRIVPLTHVLNNGEQVEVLTARTGGPSRDWMVPALGYLATGRARQKVRQWFRKVDFERNRDAGRTQVERELKRLGLADVALDRAVTRFNFVSLDSLYAGVGAGDITPSQVANAVDDIFNRKPDTSVPTASAPAAPAASGDSVLIEGVGNLMHHLARCCKPVPDDPVIGYITRGRGVTVHRRDCSNILRAIHENSPQLVAVEWGSAGRTAYSVDVQVRAYDRKGLVHDISGVLTNTKARVEGFNSSVDPGSRQADIRFTVQVSDIEQLSALLNRLSALPNVTEVKRVSQ